LFSFGDADQSPRFYVKIDQTQLDTTAVNLVLEKLEEWILKNQTSFETLHESPVLVCESCILDQSDAPE